MCFQVCDKVSNPTLISIVGNNLLSTAFLLIGPVPFLSHLLTASLNYEYGVVILFGVGYSLVMVSTFSRAITAVADLGFNQDDTSTQMMVMATIRRLKVNSSTPLKEVVTYFNLMKAVLILVK